MKKKKTKIKKVAKQENENINISIDEEVLANAITKAMVNYDKIKTEEKKIEEKPITKDKEKKNIFYKVKIFLRPRKYIKNAEGANVDIIKGFIKLFYRLVGGLLGILSFAFLLLGICGFVHLLGVELAWYNSVLCLMASFSMFCMNRISEILIIDVEKNKDINFLVMLFASIISIVAIVVAILK